MVNLRDYGINTNEGTSIDNDSGEPASDDDDDNGGGSPTADIFGGNRTNDGGNSDHEYTLVGPGWQEF